MKKNDVTTGIACSALMICLTLGFGTIASAQPKLATAQFSDAAVLAKKNEIFSSMSYRHDGYMTLEAWYNDLTSKSDEVNSLVDTGLADYADYLTDDEKDTLNSIKSSISTADMVKTLNQLSSDAQAIIDQASIRKTEAEETAKAVAATYSTSASSTSYAEYVESCNSGSYSGSYYDFLRDGVVYSEGKKFTYYSQSVLPGGGLDIPGRHTDGGFVKDGDGYICIASDKANGTIVDTPWGQGKVYDSGVSGETYDVYVE